MQDPDEVLRSNSRRINPVKQDNSEVIELAYRLHNASPNDFDLLGRLVYQYAGNLYKWVGVLLYYRKMANPSQEEIFSVLIKVFGSAIKQVEQFHGIEHISGWLFGIGYYYVRHHIGKNWSNNFLQKFIHGDKQDVLSSKPISACWDSMDRLPEKLRSPLILRYLFDFEIPEIATILNIQEQEVHRRLIGARNHLLVNPIEAHLDHQIQSYVDGLLDENPGEFNQLMQHLETCNLCQMWVAKIESLEKTLSECIKNRWVFPPPGDGELDSLIQSIINNINQPKSTRKVHLRLREAVWILGLALTFIGMSIVLMRFTALGDELKQADITPTQSLPPIVQIQPGIASPQYSNDIPTEPLFVEPAFSSDGKWAIFASIKSVPSTWRYSLPTIEIYNREANTIQVINEGTTPLDKPWIWWDLAPSISGDGRWITYVSTSNDPKTKGEPCETPEHNTCLDLFLYDRETGSTKRLTRSANGGPADGDSLAPTLSEDGQWVAFWSTAENLVNGFKNICQQDEIKVTCLYVYINNLETGKIDWIPIPTIPGDPVYGVDRISLSADGRYVGFTVTPTMPEGTPSNGILSAPNSMVNSIDGTVMNTSIPDIMHSSEAIVYDRETGSYELENQAQDGTPGDGESSSPVLSADGRYVAFTSASTNIVAGDRNNSTDVFLRDRKTGEVELISVSSVGWKGRSDSGLSYSGKGYYSLNISRDGRYVIFESTATNLGQDFTSECNKIDISHCSYLYVHDRQTGTTEWITALPNPDFIFFPEISSDGRWVSFMQSIHNCSSSNFLCSNVMLYDRQHSWMTSLTKYEQKLPNLGWSYSDSLAIPWQTWESTALAFSPDGIRIALGGADSKVRIWQISDGRHSGNNDDPNAILEIDGNEYISALTFTSDGGWLAAGTTSGSVYVWKLSDGKLVNLMQDQSDLVRKIEFSQDNTYLVISTLNGAWIWSLADSQLSKVDNFSIGTTFTDAIDISAGGNMLASARNDGSVWLQKLPSGLVIGRLSNNQQYVSNLAFSEDGSLLAVRSSNGAINIWQIKAIDSEHASIKHINTIRSYVYDGALVFSPDNKYLASPGMAGGVTLWDVPEGNIFTLSASANVGKVYSLAFSTDGDKLASVFENGIVLWGLSSDRPSHYYVHSDADNYVDSPPIPVSTANDIPELQSLDNRIVISNLNLDQAALLSKFQLLIPTHLPEIISFTEATINFDGSIWLRYDAYNEQVRLASLYIYEKFIGETTPPTMTIGSGAEVTLTQLDLLLGSTFAEYVQGDWLWSQSFTAPTDASPNAEVHEVWHWYNSSDSQRLRWQQNGLIIAEYYQVYKPYTPVLNEPLSNNKLSHLSSYMGEEDLVQIASGMMPFAGVNSAISPSSSDQAGLVNPWKVNSFISGMLFTSIPYLSLHCGNNRNMALR